MGLAANTEHLSKLEKMSPLQVGRVLRASQMVRGKAAVLACSASRPLHTTHARVHTHILAGTSVPAEPMLSSPAMEQRLPLTHESQEVNVWTPDSFPCNDCIMFTSTIAVF